MIILCHTYKPNLKNLQNEQNIVEYRFYTTTIKKSLESVGSKFLNVIIQFNKLEFVELFNPQYIVLILVLYQNDLNRAVCVLSDFS